LTVIAKARVAARVCMLDFAAGASSFVVTLTERIGRLYRRRWASGRSEDRQRFPSAVLAECMGWGLAGATGEAQTAQRPRSALGPLDGKRTRTRSVTRKSVTKIERADFPFSRRVPLYWPARMRSESSRAPWGRDPYELERSVGECWWS
jgi:hypothetical protein